MKLVLFKTHHMSTLPPVVGAMVVLEVLTACMVTVNVRRYIREINLTVIAVWLGWLLSFSIIVIAPLDTIISEDIMFIFWKTIYWTSFTLGWIVFPIMQSYSSSGEFRAWDKFTAALKENIIIYVIGGGSIGIFLIWFAAAKGINWLDIESAGVVAGNAYGLILFFICFSYAVVFIPRHLWLMSNNDLLLNDLYADLATHKSVHDDQCEHLMRITKMVNTYDQKIKHNHPFRPYIDIMAALVEPSEATYEEAHFMTYDALVKVHRELIKTIYAVKRSDYHVKLTVDKINACQSGGVPIIKIIILRTAAILFTLISGVFVWSNCIAFITNPNMSVISLLIDAINPDSWIVSYVCIGFTGFCSYWSLFSAGGWFEIIPNGETNHNSILFSTSYLCRLGMPIVYNFLLMAHMDKTTFVVAMHPPLDDYTAHYLPLIMIVLLVIFIFKNLCSAKNKSEQIISGKNIHGNFGQTV